MEDHVHLAAAILFGCALVHTFSAGQLYRLGNRWPRHGGLFHLLGEIEVVFGFWAMVLLLALVVLAGWDDAVQYAESRRFTEPLFVFVIMVIAASHPVIQALRWAMARLARLLPVHDEVAAVWLGLALLPLLGSLVTEPAAMTLAAMMLAPRIFREGIPERLKYLALGVLFVNVSIGGTLTSYAAPPVLMVASAWSWDSAFMARTFGWRAAIGVLVNATVVTLLLRRHLRQAGGGDAPQGDLRLGVPPAVALVHLLFLAGVVATAHHPVLFLWLFMFFLGFTLAYDRHQQPLLIREALLVAFFLAGLVVLGGMQEWWLQPLVSGLEPGALFFGALALTAVTDNAALTYLGSLIEGLSDAAKYALVAGAVAGGGLTVIANAPNPAGVALLRKGFNDGTIGAIGLLLGAAGPTVVAAVCFLV
ncbi:putative Na+/H+ antiporter [Ramlibacter sp.]|uniref:putative Na+/H+ antiporter n=1 Tax=Ramlibacter sp. TaxID=1917967 RepID=UPI0017C839CD|nr:putative Na+/H+ antiporter [Ramlibacter sp.]MBA2675861.1 putative Na+/H+ antiporter [Ramlibacter sp.]